MISCLPSCSKPAGEAAPAVEGARKKRITTASDTRTRNRLLRGHKNIPDWGVCCQHHIFRSGNTPAKTVASCFLYVVSARVIQLCPGIGVVLGNFYCCIAGSNNAISSQPLLRSVPRQTVVGGGSSGRETYINYWFVFSIFTIGPTQFCSSTGFISLACYHSVLTV